MGAIVGPSKSHSSFASYINWSTTALGSTVCGGRLFCKSGTGIAWIVAPAATQVGATWNGSSGSVVGNKPLVSDWSSLNTALTNGGLTPSQWFVPSIAQLQSGYTCRTYWDSFSSSNYWSSTELNATGACVVLFNIGLADGYTKSNTFCVRAFRCVTY
jgi:hypothetical protein